MGSDGRDVGKVRLLAKLAQGGMGDVHLAVNVGPGGFNKIVVLKQLRASLAEDPQFLTMFLDEARIAARLNHRNIVQTYEVTVDPGPVGPRYFITMEYLDGQPYHKVRRRLASAKKFTLAHELRILSECLAGLHDAHELADFDGTPLEIVHRDVSPHNVFVTYDGQVKIVDFGIAKAMDSGSETQAGVFKGKVTYVSPEQAKGAPCDRRADIFSVGVMLWEAVAGERLWANMPEVAILNNLLSGTTPPLRTANPEAPEELVRICEKAMACDREHRYATAAEMQADLDQYVTKAAARAVTEDGAPPFEHPTAKGLSLLVSEAFADERRALKSLVDGQLRAIRGASTDSSASHPQLHDASSAPSHGTPSNLPPTSPSVPRPSEASAVDALAPSGPFRAASTTSISAILANLTPMDPEAAAANVPPDPPSALTLMDPTGSVTDDDDLSPLPQLFPTSPPTASLTAVPTSRNLAEIVREPAQSRAQSWILAGLAFATLGVLGTLAFNGALLPKPPERTISAVPMPPSAEETKAIEPRPADSVVADMKPSEPAVPAPAAVPTTSESPALPAAPEAPSSSVASSTPHVVPSRPVPRRHAGPAVGVPVLPSAVGSTPSVSPGTTTAGAPSAEPTAAPGASTSRSAKPKRRIDSEDPYSQ
ncbi:MAG: protein kinase [Polyangiaceae bacterium]